MILATVYTASRFDPFPVRIWSTSWITQPECPAGPLTTTESRKKLLFSLEDDSRVRDGLQPHVSKTGIPDHSIM